MYRQSMYNGSTYYQCDLHHTFQLSRRPLPNMRWTGHYRFVSIYWTSSAYLLPMSVPFIDGIFFDADGT